MSVISFSFSIQFISHNPLPLNEEKEKHSQSNFPLSLCRVVVVEPK